VEASRRRPCFVVEHTVDAGVPDVTAISPDGYSLDNFYLARPGVDEIQLDLFGDYKSDVALYPTFQ
jgi:hypothetical protein